MAGPAQIRGAGLGMDGHLNGAGAILGGDPRADAVLGTRIHAHGEGGLVAVGVAIHHQRQVEGIEPLAFHRQADQATRLSGHEVDLFRGGELSGADQVAFVLSVLVVHHHHHFAIADRRQAIGDGVELESAWVQGWRARRARVADTFIEPGTIWRS